MTPVSACASGSEGIARAWQQIAADWQSRDALQTIRVCNDCSKGIYLVTDQTGIPYVYEPDEILAMTVLHLRNHHIELNPDA